MHGVPWRTYSMLREALDISGLRMTYYKGALEFTSPSPEHELIKTTIARLVEMYALEVDAPLYGYGSTTFRRELEERGLEPDECYCVGEELRQYPDLPRARSR
jgi:Uma2 family endonuclease